MEATGNAPGAHNDLTDIPGLLVGSHTDAEHASGVTVVLCPEGGAVGGVDVRGSAPATRETDQLMPVNLVERVDAVVLCGGSVYGLAAADGVVRWLAERGLGFPLGGGEVAPIVPAAALFDLGRGARFTPPVEPVWGVRACRAAGSGPLAQGSVGAGAGAHSGGIKGGLGSASEVLSQGPAAGLTVAALVAVNSLGSVVCPATGRLWEAGLELAGEFRGRADLAVRLPPPGEPQPGQNTSIGVVAANARLTKAQAQKIAQMAQDGLGRAIRPAHTMFDGDALFCLGTGEHPLPEAEGFFAAPQAPAINELGRAAADCVSRACIHAVLAAVSAAGAAAWRELPPL